MLRYGSKKNETTNSRVQKVRAYLVAARRHREAAHLPKVQECALGAGAGAGQADNAEKDDGRQRHAGQLIQ